MNNPRTLRFNMMIKESVTNKGKKMQAASVHARMIETLMARELRRCLRGVRGGDVRFLLDRLRGGLSSSLLMMNTTSEYPFRDDSSASVMSKFRKKKDQK